VASNYKRAFSLTEVLGYASRREIDEGKLTEQKVDALLQSLVVPHMTLISDLGEIPVAESNDDTGNFHSTTELKVRRLADGSVFVIPVEVWRTPEGLRSAVVRSLVHASWLVRFGRQENGRYLPGELFRSAILGIQADRAFLESIGINVAVPIGPDKPARTWEDLLNRNRALYAKFDKGAT
jgi:hypothetical protein